MGTANPLPTRKLKFGTLMAKGFTTYNCQKRNMQEIAGRYSIPTSMDVSGFDRESRFITLFRRTGRWGACSKHKAVTLFGPHMFIS